MLNFKEFVVNELLSKIPDAETPTSDLEILRAGILAELDAVNVYTQMASVASDPRIKSLLLDIAKEEKTHIGEFEELLKQMDAEYTKELENGAREVKDME